MSNFPARYAPAARHSGSRIFASADRARTPSSFSRCRTGSRGGTIVRRLYGDHRTVIAGARNRLSGRVIRFGTMGAFSAATILTDLLHLEDVLTKLGLPVEAGAGLKAATEHLAKTK
jgi:aspartate aminotransferase-like enzyme